jgi:hypothetical protein
MTPVVKVSTSRALVSGCLKEVVLTSMSLSHNIEVVAWNRSPERAVALEERDARRADSPNEVALGIAAVITMLPPARPRPFSPGGRVDSRR